jgi:hypothetical protein
VHRENAPAHHLDKKMTLQEIFFGTFNPPAATNVRHHRINLSDGRRYVPKEVKEKLVETRKTPVSWESSQLVLRQIRKAKTPVTANDISKKVFMTRNHCSILLSMLFKDGLVNRKMIHGNGTRWYEYTAK